MSITSKTRKVLWAQSGNKCAICKSHLFSSNVMKKDLNIGEECHIVSKKKNGPRHRDGLSNYDLLDNLILLCRNHHKEIDALTGLYSESVIQNIKKSHEYWVQSTLETSLNKSTFYDSQYFFRIELGKDLLVLQSDFDDYVIDYESPKNKIEEDFLKGLFHDLDTGFWLSNYFNHPYLDENMVDEILEELLQNGFFLYVENELGRKKRHIKAKSELLILFRRTNNPDFANKNQSIKT